ncbi:hypothetical protein CRENBAI_009901 [Crenichthys baileyi]|uniref:Uncharacterized protein n=1 Tax=Crenichthys baileyi TaxID=28760 RepID=A0AAV9SNH8_9TELE
MIFCNHLGEYKKDELLEAARSGNEEKLMAPALRQEAQRQHAHAIDWPGNETKQNAVDGTS